jgi:hypothetical protein
MTYHASVFRKNGEHQKNLKPIDNMDRTVSEDTLQKILHSQPDLLASTEIDPDFRKLIPLGREISVLSGSMDLLLMTPEGRLCIVETKLWRNNQAHREVVAQILDYAKDLANLSFNDLVEKVTKKKGLEAQNEFFNMVNRQGLLDEIELQENITQFLAEGRFLLLIVGDTIRPNLILLSDYIQSTPHIQYKLALLEVHMYELCSDKLLAIPHLIGKTVEQTRAVVKIQFEEKRPEVEVSSIEPTAEQKGKVNYKEFVNLMPDGFSDFFIPYYDEWIKKGYTIYWGTRGLSVRLTVDGKKKTVFATFPHSTTIYSRKYEKNSDLPAEICQHYRDSVKDSENLVQFLASNRVSIRLQDMSLEDFALHMQEANNAIHKFAKYYEKRT